MKPTIWRKFSYRGGECLQNINYDKMINRKKVMAGNKSIENILIIRCTHLD